MGEGYGSVTYSGKVYHAHRVAYELAVGPVPPKHDLHHTCENRRCVNPDHLAVVTRSEHMRIHAGDYCGYGHPYEERPDGKRECKVCHRNAQKRNQKRRNEQQRERRRAKAAA